MCLGTVWFRVPCATRVSRNQTYLIVEVLRTKFILPYPGIMFYRYRSYSEIQMYLPVVRTNQYFRSEIKNLEIRKLVILFRNAMYITVMITHSRVIVLRRFRRGRVQ